MATCLLALGSNLDDRAALIDAALRNLDALPNSRILRRSQYRTYPSLGGPAGQPDFLNAAALLETSLAPSALFEHLLQIETEHGRRRTERWSARTLDIDVLLYDDLVVETPSLVVPHPRMSFRRFVLEPAAEVAGEMFHPIIGWRVAQLARHLEVAGDCIAIISQSQVARRALCELAATRFGARAIAPLINEQGFNQHVWPQQMTMWLKMPNQPANSSTPAMKFFEGFSHPATSQPKLSVLVEPELQKGDEKALQDWAEIRDTTGRGPTLWIRNIGSAEAACEFSAAIESVWPHLGRAGDTRVQ